MWCSTNWAMKPLTLGAGQLWVHMFPWKKWVLMIYEINHIWTAEMKWGFFTQLHKLRSLRRSFLHFHFISAVQIWSISYIINSHFFHGNIWTHNWPAPNFSGFLAQLVEHRTGIARSRVQTPLTSWIFFVFVFVCLFVFFSGFFTQLRKLRSLRRSFLHFYFISAFHIWFISYIINSSKIL